MTKVGDKGLRMSSGEVKHFASEKKRDNFERVAEAYKHGWHPRGNHAEHSKSHSKPAHKRHK